MSETSIFMRIEGRSIKGSATTSNYRGPEGWIFLDAVDFGVRRDKDDQKASKKGRDWKSSSRPVADPVKIAKKPDLSSCDLFDLACEKTKTISKIEIHVCSPEDDGSLKPYLKYELEDCVVLDYEMSLDFEKPPTERLTVDYMKLTIRFRERDAEHKLSQTENVNSYDFTKSGGK
jgi:type VI secretion system Hcp family effector